jgi:hypothetical protein
MSLYYVILNNSTADGCFFSALPIPFIQEQIEFVDESLKYLRKNPDGDSVDQSPLKK